MSHGGVSESKHGVTTAEDGVEPTWPAAAFAKRLRAAIVTRRELRLAARSAGRPSLAGVCIARMVIFDPLRFDRGRGQIFAAGMPFS